MTFCQLTDGQGNGHSSFIGLLTAVVTFLTLLYKGKQNMDKQFEAAGLDFDVKLENGMLVLMVKTADGIGQAQVSVNADALIDKLVAKTDNKIDDALGAIVKAALKQV